MAHNDTPWIGLQGTNTLYLQSGQFTATVKTSTEIESAIEVPVGISWDGVDTPIAGRDSGDTVRKLYIVSGQFTTTIKESEDITASSGNLRSISIDLTNVPYSDRKGGDSRLVLQSGQISSTLKTSQSVAAVDNVIEGISYDGINTPWTGGSANKLYLQSGQFTSTLKTSEDVSGVTGEIRGITYDGTNTPWSESPLGLPKLHLQSGQFTATIKDSQSLNTINDILTDNSTNAVSLSCDTSGTMITPTPGQAAIQAGGRTLLLTLSTGRLPPTSDTWHADIGGNNARTSALLAGMVSSGAEANGWNNEVTPLLTFAEVARTSDVLVTITMPAVPGYSITIPELVTITIPVLALTGANGPLASVPSIVIELAPVIDDTPWIGAQAQKLYLQSNTFTSTLKTSEDINPIISVFPAGIAYDGTNTPWGAEADQWIILTSGQFSSTIKVSTDVSGLGWAPLGISSTQAPINTPIVEGNSDKLYIISGQFSTTIKTSEDISAIDTLVRGISDDGTNTPWTGISADKLYLQSGQFTSTLKTSEDVSAQGNTRSVSFRSGDTPWASQGITVQNELFLQSGQFTSTIKDSEVIFTIDSAMAGMDHDARFGAGAGLALNVVPSDSDITEQEIRDGGITILLGLSGDTWVATVGADNSITQALIDGMLSVFGEARGWNNIVRDGLTAAQVTRNADTLVTVTLPAFSDYEITADDVVTVTAPAVALTGAVAIIGTPSFSVAADPTPPAPRRIVRAKYVNSEWESYISPDGVEYPFHTPHSLGRWIVSQTGWGTPPIEYITQRGPFQHGVTVKDFFLQPRVIQLLIRQAFCDRDEWWDGRAALLNEIRPNRQTISTAVVPGRLQRCLPDGTLRAIEVFISDGPRFEQRVVNTWDEWAFQEVLRFIAHDPVIFDPTRNDVNFTIVLDSELVFPITFPIEFGPGEVDDTLNINYVGTWESLPIIVITGPIEEPRIDNLTTGEKLEFSIDIDPGQVVTIDLSYGSKTVVDQAGNNLIGGLTADSDLATFHIAPDPEAPLGVNQMRLQGMHATGVTDIEIRYFDRYFGI